MNKIEKWDKKDEIRKLDKMNKIEKGQKYEIRKLDKINRIEKRTTLHWTKINEWSNGKFGTKLKNWNKIRQNEQI